ncbi:MAG: hypothetical protein MR051_01730 [Lentisphaeria bacterium]|nr:hypothetical protein [Lentisphaeria bacterium]
MDWFWQTFAEYSLHTTLAETELTEGLRRECPRCGLTRDWGPARKICRPAPERPALLRHPGDPRCLIPIFSDRNMLRGRVFVSVRTSPDAGGCNLRIVVRPGRGSLVFVTCWLAFLIAWSCAVAATGNWKLLALSAFMSFWIWLVLVVCRRRAAEDIPMIKTAFVLLIDRLEREKAR